MSSNKSPGNARRNDASKQGNEQNSEKQGSTQLDQAAKQPGGQGAQQDQGSSKTGQQRTGSDSGGGKS